MRTQAEQLQSWSDAYQKMMTSHKEVTGKDDKSYKTITAEPITIDISAAESAHWRLSQVTVLNIMLNRRQDDGKQAATGV